MAERAEEPPDPGHAGSAAEFVGEMRRLRAWSGLTFRQLERNAAEAGDVLPHSTLVAALRRDRLPREELLRAYARACGCGPEAVTAWVTARRRLAVAEAAPAGVSPAVTPRPAPHPPRRRRLAVVAAGTALLLAVAGGSAYVSSSAFSQGSIAVEECPRPLMIGAYGTCVRRLQEQLRRRGLDLPADAWYGPYTKMRVAAFQTFVGLANTGMADDETWSALTSAGFEVGARWPASRVERRLREVFTADPSGAVALAHCLSNTDPLWIYSTEPGVRRWGLFQFTDLEVYRADATQAMALDPEWNIRAAHALWRRTGDFRHWSCRPGALPVTPDREVTRSAR